MQIIEKEGLALEAGIKPSSFALELFPTHILKRVSGLVATSGSTLAWLDSMLLARIFLPFFSVHFSPLGAARGQRLFPSFITLISILHLPVCPPHPELLLPQKNSLGWAQ